MERTTINLSPGAGGFDGISSKMILEALIDSSVDVNDLAELTKGNITTIKVY